MPHIRKNGQPCQGRPFQEATTMSIMCSTCREPVGPPPAAGAKPKTIAASPANVNEALRRRLHPEAATAPSPYAESIAASQGEAFSLIRKKTQEKIAQAQRNPVAEPSLESAIAETGVGTAVAERPSIKRAAKAAKAAKGGKRGRKPKVVAEPIEMGEELLTSDDEPTVTPVALPPSPSADIVTAPLADTPPLMAALQAAAVAK